MPRGNLDNFGKKKAHAFGSKEREAAQSKAEKTNKELHNHGMAPKAKKAFNPKGKWVRDSRGDWDPVKKAKPGQVNRPASKQDAYKPLGPGVHGMQTGTGGYGLTHGSVSSHGYGYKHR